ncbi:hypothetical protein ACWEPC_05570 [Nonomuraea sp. NPDC004297]
MPGTRYVQGSSTLTDADIEAALGSLRADHFRDGEVLGWTWDDNSGTLRVETSLGVHHFRPVVAVLSGDLMGETKIRSGSRDDPHLVQFASGTAADQAPRTWLHEITDTLQRLAEPARPGAWRRLLRGGRRPHTHDACVLARLNELGYLVERWHQTADPVEQRLLAVDIDGVLRDLAARGHAAPPPPWAPAGQPRPPALPAVPDGQPSDAAVQALIDAFHQVEQNLSDQVESKKNSAKKADDEAKKAVTEGRKARRHQDQGSQERWRKAREEVRLHRATRNRHLRMARLYQKALDRARAARESYEKYQAVPPNRRRSIGRARRAHVGFREAWGNTLPSEESWTDAVPTGRMAHLNRLTETVNDVLGQNGVVRTYTASELERFLRQNFHKLLTEDGAVLRVDNAGNPAEVRIKLQIDDLVEIFDPSVVASEIMMGVFSLGGRTVTATQSNSVGRSPRFDSRALAAMYRDESVFRWIGSLLNIKLGASGGRTGSVTGGRGVFAQFGAVRDNRGESMLYEAAATWTVAIRTRSSPEWRDGATVNSGAPGDASGQRMWFSHAHVEPPPKKKFRIDPGRQDPNLPNVTVTGMSDLERILKDVAEKLGGDFAKIGTVAQHNLRTAIVDTLPGALREAVNGGLTLTIPTGGGAKVRITINTEVLGVPSSQMVGRPTPDEWEEEVLNDFAGVPGGASGGGSLGANISAGLDIALIEDVDLPGPYAPTMGPSPELGRAAGQSYTSTANAQAIHPSVHRKTGHRQAYKLRLKHTITIEGPGRPTRSLPFVTGTALVSMQEAAAFRFGLPIDAAARVHVNGTPKTGADGLPVLRGDPQPEPPTGRRPELPTWLGDGAGRMRGAGPALVQEITGLDDVAGKVLQDLGERGVIPKIENGELVFSGDELEQASQLLNLNEVVRQLSAVRTQAGYDQAAQDGLLIDLVRHRANAAPEHYTVRVKLVQNFDDVTYIGQSTSQTVVNLDIGSDTSGRGHSRSRTYPGKVGWKMGEAPDQGQNGLAHEVNVGGGGGHTRNVGSSVGSTQNIVTLEESTGPVAIFSLGHHLIVEILQEGEVKNSIPAVAGAAKLVIATDLLPETEPRNASVGKLPDSVLARARLLHLDAGGMLEAGRRALPRGMRAGSHAFQHFAALLNVRNLVSHPEWEEGAFGSETGIDARASPARSSLSVSGEYGQAEVVGVVDHVTGDIKFALGSAGINWGKSWNGNVGASVSGSDLDDQGTSRDGGKVTLPSRSGTTSTSRSVLDIWGTEELTIETGRHYILSVGVGFQLTGRESLENGSSPDENLASTQGTALLTLPEYDALRLYADGEFKLPLHLVADAVERFLNGSLDLDRTLATPLVQRYLADLAALPPGEAPPLSGKHTLRRLLDRLREVAQLGPEQGEKGKPLRGRLDRALSAAVDLINRGRQVVLAPPYVNAMGASMVESLTLTDGQGLPTRLGQQVLGILSEIAPEVLAAVPTLRGEVGVDFARTRADMHVNDMWSEAGYQKSYVATGSADSGIAEEITVTVKVVPQGAAEREQATLVGHTNEAGGIKQRYRYTDITESKTSSGSWGFGGEYNGGDDGRGRGLGLSTDRTRSVTGARNSQETRLQRLKLFLGMARVQQEFTLEVTVECRPLPRGKTKTAADAVAVRRRPVRTETRRLNATLVRRIPGGMVRPLAAKPAERPAVNDPRRVELHPGFFPDSLFEGRPSLLQVVTDRLGKLTGNRNMTLSRAELVTRLSVDALLTGFEQMSRPGGARMVSVAWLDADDQGVDVTIEANLSDLEVIAGPFEGEIGEVDRTSTTTSTTMGRGRLAPFSGTASGNDDVTGLGYGKSVGEQSSEGMTDMNGVRTELSEFKEGELYTVRLRVDYDLTFQRRARRPGRTDKAVGAPVHLRHASHGEVYVTLFGEQLTELRARMEAGVRFAPTPLATEPVIATEAAPGLIPQLGAARLQARQDGKPVLVIVQESDGEHRYLVHPDGTVHSETPDGGFAQAFSTLSPGVLAAAARQNLDLRHVFMTSGEPGTFTQQVLRELGVTLPPAAPAYPYQPPAVPSPALPGTPFDAAARPAGDPGLSLAEISAQDVAPTDFDGAVTGLTWAAPDVLVVQSPSLPDQHVQVTFGDPGESLPGRTDLRAGTPRDPHVMVLSPRLDPQVVSSVMVHELSRLALSQAGQAAGGPQGVAGASSPASAEGHGVHDPHVVPRLNEHAHLSRKWRQATEQAVRDRLAEAITAIAADITRRGGTPPAAPWDSGVTHGAPIPESGFVADGRPASEGELTVPLARRLFNRDVELSDFSGATDTVLGIRWEEGSDTILVDTRDFGTLHFRVKVRPVEGGYLGNTTVENVAGTADDPHLMTLAPGVADDQIGRLVLHEISDVLQHRMAGDGHTHTSPDDRARDECVSARRNELTFLRRKLREATEAGDTDAQRVLLDEIAAVEQDLAIRTGGSHQGTIDSLINFDEPGEFAAMGVEGDPVPIGANLSEVTLSDGTSALLLEYSTRQERDLALLMARLAGRLGLVAAARAAGDLGILIDWTPADASSEFLGTREAVLTGYLVALADVTPFVTRPAFHLHPSSTPLLELFLRDDASGEREWLSNPLSPSDVHTLRTMLEDARADFAELGLLPQFGQIMARHESLAGGPLAANAIGVEDVLAAAPGQRLRLGHLDRLTTTDEHPPAPARTGAASRLINAARRLRHNIRQRAGTLPPPTLRIVITFADGSQAERIPFFIGSEVLVRALVRRALGLDGPAVDMDEVEGYVWRAYGSNELRASLATGVSEVIGASGRTTEVVFGDGRRALRHEFPARSAADEFEARLEEAREATDGKPGFHRATPFIVYEELTGPPESTAEARARLATRALYTLLSQDRPMNHATLRRLLDANPLLVHFGSAFDWEFRAGAPVLSSRDVADLTARFEALRGIFDRLGLIGRYERILHTLSTFTGSDSTRLIPLAISEAPATVEYRVPAWRPPPGPVLGDLLRNDHLAQVTARHQQDVLSRADAELAERPSAEGYVFARLPGGLVPEGIRPGAEFAVDTLLDGVDSAALLAEAPHGVRVTILASDYVPVGDLSGRPHHALFRSGARFAVTAVLTTDGGETHYVLVQQPARTRTEPVVTPTVELTPDLARNLAPRLHRAVSETRAGVRVRSGSDDTRPVTRRMDGAFVVEGSYSEQGMTVGGRTVPAEVIAAMLLNSPSLPPNAAILLTGPHDGSTAFAQNLARFTGRTVLAADGPIETTPRGHLRIDGPGRSPGDLRIFLPADTSAAAAQQLRAWLGPALAALPDNPSTQVTGNARPGRSVQPPSLASVRPGGVRGGVPADAAGRIPAPPLSSRHRDLIFDHRQEVTAGIWYRDESSSVMPTADPRLLRRSGNIIEVAIAGDGTGFLIGSERLSAADLATMLAHDPRVIGEPGAWIRILGCETARNPAVLQELADLTGRSILAGDEIVYIGADRAAHTAAVQEYTPDGRPIFPRDDNGQWLQAHPAAPVAAPDRPAMVPSAPVAHQRGLPPSLVEGALSALLSDWQLFPEQGVDGTVSHLSVDGVEVVQKRTDAEKVKAEILGALVGRLIGADVPVVVGHPSDPKVVFMEYLQGFSLPGTSVRNVRGAILIELLDLLIVNNDRHNDGNLKLTERGLAGFDHGRSHPVRPPRSLVLGPALWGNFVARNADGAAVWVDNPLSRQDVDVLTEIMQSLRPFYEHYGRQVSYDVALDRLYHIGMHAKGEVSLIAPAAPAPTRTQHHFGWDFDDHDAIVQDATRRLADGADVASIVPYLTHDAIGLDLAFGLELEFTHVGGDLAAWHEDIATMARELHRAGLAASPEVFPHHRAPAWVNGRSHMEWESIGDHLGGEFITGILRDTGQTWAELPLITEIIRSHGGEITPDAGGHIHVGAPRLGTDVNALHRLLTLYSGYEDILFRLGQDPREPYGMHRPYHACRPNDLPGAADASAATLRSANGRPAALNLSSVVGTDNDHVEFRHNDGHLDPSIIQARIKLAVAMVNYALHGGEYLPPRDQLGIHLEHDASPEQDAASFIDMVNTLFTRRADKEQLTALFAITQWQAASDDGRWEPR